MFKCTKNITYISTNRKQKNGRKHRNRKLVKLARFSPIDGQVCARRLCSFVFVMFYVKCKHVTNLTPFVVQRFATLHLIWYDLTCVYCTAWCWSYLRNGDSGSSKSAYIRVILNIHSIPDTRLTSIDYSSTTYLLWVRLDCTPLRDRSWIA